METEIVYLGHDNRNDLLLTQADANGVQQPYPTTDITEITLTVNGTTVVSTDAAAGAIRWGQGGWDVGEIRLVLGDEILRAGEHHAPLVVYESSYPNGIVWGYVPTQIVAEVEVT